MTQMYQDVLHAAMSLPVDQRSKLVDALLGSLPDEEQMPLDDEWREIVKQRFKDYEEGRDKGVPWEEVQARIRERILRHGQGETPAGS